MCNHDEQWLYDSKFSAVYKSSTNDPTYFFQYLYTTNLKSYFYVLTKFIIQNLNGPKNI